jgi:imidazolonepropionase
MGAHAYRPNYKGKPNKYIDFMLFEVITPIYRKWAAEFIDVFCEKAYFHRNTDQAITGSRKKDEVLN